MEVERQTCRACGSRQMENLMVRQPGKPPSVYVRCAECGDRVAQIEVAHLFVRGQELESLLEQHGQGAAESGRDSLEAHRRMEEEFQEGFDQVIAELESSAADGPKDNKST